MNGMRVLLVDDSIVVRRVVGAALTEAPGIAEVRTAGSGRQALQRLDEGAADVVVLDVEMPGMNGLDTLAEIRRRQPTLPVVMFSALTASGAAVTLEAMARGASDYLAKPTAAGQGGRLDPDTRQQLLGKIEALCRRGGARAAPVVRRASPRLRPVEAVVVGVSTGGPNALVEVLSGFDADFPVPILIVQHMPPTFTRLLAERLDAVAKLTVREAEAGVEPRPGEAWLAPGDQHLVLERRAGRVLLQLNREAPENSCRPAVDVLFRSAARVHGGNVLAVVLTGMGQDGLRGIQELAPAGAQVVVQDEATSVVWGMPGFVARAGLADAVLPLPAIAAEITRRVRAARIGVAR
ncbi:MAG: chemotaxis response regulator protein-glutamate methylesterase [Planctomycetes bacterium]|nr:chemotaxis response regulator protein-glutamate methylesterase [Planctomycetota bacterium]